MSHVQGISNCRFMHCVNASETVFFFFVLTTAESMAMVWSVIALTKSASTSEESPFIYFFETANINICLRY